MRFSLSSLIAVAVVAVALVAWVAFKPIRVLAPQLVGVQCTQANVCVDDMTALERALTLRDESVRFVESRVGKIRQVPTFVFCSSEECAQRFGFKGDAAYHVGTFGVVISPRGWHSHFARHELIHHLQMENIGALHALFFTPSWFIEGMAYSLSEDPRRPLPRPMEDWRTQFERWYPSASGQDFWVTARALR